jgi:N-formylglutamate deformylase
MRLGGRVRKGARVGGRLIPPGLLPVLWLEWAVPILPYILRAPKLQTAPVVFTSAHSGRCYAPDFLAAARLDPVAIRRSEDSFVDELFADAPGLGAPLLAATFPRAFCDPNREAWELDPAMFEEALPAWVNTASVRVHAGLGTIARVVASGEAIYRGKLSFAEAERRVREYWQPWHTALGQLVAATQAQFGFCLLIDCHSMPTQTKLRRGPCHADFVLGDAFGISCGPGPAGVLEARLRADGYVVARNDPYAGGYITRHYGQPKRGVHALQIEIARELYMDEARIEKTAGFEATQAAIRRLIGAITGEAVATLA